MPAHQEFQSVEYITPRYVPKNDADGDMLYLENRFTGEALVLCGSNTEIFQLLENAISHIPMGDQEPPMRSTMKPIQALIQKAHNKGLLRYSPPNLVWSDLVVEHKFELRRTAMSGVEFGYNLSADEITWAIQSIDGVELEVDDFIVELDRAVHPLKVIEEEQPCQQYTRARAIVDEEPEVTDYNDEEERIYLVTQITEVKAYDDLQAIQRVNDMHGSCELVSQEAEPRLEKFRIGAVYEVWAENSQHAVEQFYDIVGTDNNVPIVNLIEEEES